jgi:hypothetical protein
MLKPRKKAIHQTTYGVRLRLCQSIAEESNQYPNCGERPNPTSLKQHFT